MPMMNRMVVSNVVHRPVRSLISVIAIALEVTMILLIVGFSLGTLNDSRQKHAGIGAGVIVLPPASSAIVGMTGAPASIKVADILAKLPHVTSVAPRSRPLLYAAFAARIFTQRAFCAAAIFLRAAADIERFGVDAFLVLAIAAAGCDPFRTFAQRAF
jgi:hypothetical protein